MGQPAIFLDRDGTLIEEVGYPTRPDQIRILGGVTRALVRLAGAGYRLVVVTNQSAIARGLMNEDDLNRFHEALDEQLDLLGARVDAYYACPHLPKPEEAQRQDLAVECDCRKPKPGLLLRAAEDLEIDLSRSWMVGDRWRDVAAGHAAGVRTVKLTAPPASAKPKPDDLAPPTAQAADLNEAADFILAHMEPEPPPEKPRPEPPHEEPPHEEEAEQPEGDTPAVLAAPTPPEPVPEPLPAAEEELSLREEPPAVAAPPPPVAVRTQPQPAPAPKPPAEPQPRVTCARCGVDIAPADVASGAAGIRDKMMLCPECLPKQPQAGEDRIPDNTTDLLRAILMELRRVGRARRIGSLTFFRMLAYIVQAGAVFCGLILVLVGPAQDKAMYLQMAILLQLLVLTLLLLERNP